MIEALSPGGRVLLRGDHSPVDGALYFTVSCIDCDWRMNPDDEVIDAPPRDVLMAEVRRHEATHPVADERNPQ